MRKLLLLITVAIFSTQIVSAQKNGVTRFSFGPEIGFATGTSSINNSLGLGMSIQAEHFFQEDLSGTAFFGFDGYVGRSINTTSNHKGYNVFPLRIGARYYVGGGVFCGAQLGLGF